MQIAYPTVWALSVVLTHRARHLGPDHRVMDLTNNTLNIKLVVQDVILQLAFLRQWLLANHSRTNAHYFLFLYGIRLRVRVRFRVNVSVRVKISVRVRVWVEGTFDKIDIRCFTCICT